MIISPGMSAAQVVELLDLQPHPEGGHYRETFRDPDGAEGRGACTLIYYLLAKGERSHWHSLGKRRNRWGIGPWSAAPSPRLFASKASSWRPRAGIHH